MRAGPTRYRSRDRETRRGMFAESPAWKASDARRHALRAVTDDDLHLLDELARQPWQTTSGARPRAWRDVDEVDVQPVDLGANYG